MEPQRRPKPAVSRKLPMQAGRDFSDAEERVALLLLNTYEFERRRFLNQQILEVTPPSAWKSNLGEIAMEKRRGTENIEEIGSLGKATKRGGAMWIELARRVIHRRVDPEAFIRRQFVSVSIDTKGGVRPPQPESFLRELAFRNYETGRLLIHRDVQVALVCQRSKFETEVTKLAHAGYALPSEKLWAMVLGNRDIDLSPLFRYCLARSIATEAKTAEPGRFTDIAKRFHEEAALQYIFAPEAYDAFWKTALPPGYAKDADETYRFMFTGTGQPGEEF